MLVKKLKSLEAKAMCSFICDCNIGDEFHYIMKYTYFSNDRKIFLPNIITFNELMNTNNVVVSELLQTLFGKSLMPPALPDLHLNGCLIFNTCLSILLSLPAIFVYIVCLYLLYCVYQ